MGLPGSPRPQPRATSPLDRRVETVRAFNRFYTRHLGVLAQGLLDSPFSLTEARILYELAQDHGRTASWFAGTLGLDAGYLSRLLRGLEQRGCLEQRRSAADGRARELVLTPAGRRAFHDLDRRARAQGREWLARRHVVDQQRLVEAMGTIHAVLDPADRPAGVRLREPGPGDLGWIVSRHGAIYHESYGWDWTFEALVARIVARFAERYRPGFERGWIAEADGRRVGCVLLTRRSATIGQLRLLLVEPSARGLGVGSRLIDECGAFARAAGYRAIRLWTNSLLAEARRLHERAGYRLVREAPHHSFGADLVGQTWHLDLRPPGRRPRR